jgi:hypothetical protein
MYQKEYSLKKMNRRLYVYRFDEKFYTPPDFVYRYVRSREDFDNLIDQLNSGSSYIQSVIEFETFITDRKRKWKSI